jgi:hypothetical protein
VPVTLRLNADKVKWKSISNIQEMNHIYFPTSGTEDWRRLLADPKKHWRTGFSARSLAYAWESASGFPPEIRDLFTSTDPPFHDVDLLLAIPEHKVLMPPYGRHPSQNDLFVLAKDSSNSLITITVEGKVSESFDKNLSEWNAEDSPGKQKRLAFIKDILGLAGGIPPTIRYQLLHRTASAILEAKRFAAKSAVMVVHSFSQSDLWFEDYQDFLKLYGVMDVKIGKLYFLTELRGIKVYSGWARGDAKFLQM